MSVHKFNFVFQTVCEEIEETENAWLWSGKWEFFLSCLTYSMNVENLWKFPFLCSHNGGGRLQPVDDF